MAKQKLGGLNCELLLVDNNCSDNTVEVVQRVWADNESPFPLMIINESIPGISNARKAGILAAQGEIFVFCDDDNWLNDDYLSNAFRIFQTDKMIFGVCRYCHPIAIIPLPDWFNKYATLYACGLPQLDNNHLITLRGAGMAIRAKILKALYTEGISHFTSGRKGKSLESCEDDELSFWLKSVGGKLLYSESLQLKHFMEERRLTVRYRENLEKEIRKSNVSLKRNHRIMLKTNSVIRKRDFINAFFPGSDGFISRLKFGFYGKKNIYFNNMKILNKLKSEYDV